MAQSSPQAASHSPSVGPNDDNNNSPDVKCYIHFEVMSLPPLLLRGILSYGLQGPSAIQQRAIVPIIKEGDVIAQAQSGTQTTSAFCIGALARLDFGQKALQALILSPTRELAAQTHEVLSRIGEFLAESNPNFCQTFVGGTRVQDDIKKIQSGAIVAVGTPGRVLDLMKRGAFCTDRMKIMILDAADEMLSQGYQEQIYEIFGCMPPRGIQICLFSATMPRDVLELAQKFIRDPTRIVVSANSLTLDGVKLYYVAVEEDHKFDALINIFDSSCSQHVVFANTCEQVDSISEKLISKTNNTVSSIHSDMPENEREKAMQHFQSRDSRVLVTTDSSPRVIDVHQQSKVAINFDLPINVEDYLQRIGRAGRCHRTSAVINLVSQRDREMIRQIEQRYHTAVTELPLNEAQEQEK